MMANGKIQDLSILGLKYARFFDEDFDLEVLKQVKNKYSYATVFSYKEIRLVGFELFKIQPTPIVDLTPKSEEIFGRFKKTVRNEIRRSEKMPDLKFEISPDSINTHFRFYKEIKAKDGARPDIKRDFEDCLFANAFFRNKLIASMSFYDNGSSLRCKHIASLRKEMGAESRVAGYAARRLIWEICQYGKSRGYKKLDLGGITFNDPQKRGILEFKSSFGGSVHDTYIYCYETGIFKFLRKLLNYFGRNIY